MNQYRFEHRHTDPFRPNSPEEMVALEFTDSEQLDDVLEKMKVFLLATGFSVQGTLEIVPENE